MNVTKQPQSSELLSEPRPYSSNAEYVRDLLRLVDLLIEPSLDDKSNNSDSLDQLRGLVVTADHVQQLLRTKPEALQGRLNSAPTEFEARIEQRVALSSPNETVLYLPRLTQLFQLNSFEVRCIIICLSLEIDRKYETLFAYFQDDVTKRQVSVDLVLKLTSSAFGYRLSARQYFRSTSPLFKYGLIEKVFPETKSLVATEIRLNDRIADFLLGNPCLDRRLESICDMVWPTESGQFADDDVVVQRVRNYLHEACLEPSNQRSVILNLSGPADLDWVCAATRDIGLPLLTCSAKQLLTVTAVDEVLRVLCRESALQPAILLIEDFDVLIDAAATNQLLISRLFESITNMSRLTLLLGGKDWRPPKIDYHSAAFLSISLPEFGSREREDTWRSELVDTDCVDVSCGAHGITALASQFKLTKTQLHQAVATAKDQSRLLGSNRELSIAALFAACRQISKQNLELGQVARQIKPMGTWETLVLPADPVQQLREICVQARCRNIVFDDWGFADKLSYGKGISVLFAGSSGTGPDARLGPA